MNSILTALLLTLIAGGATGIGGALVLFKKKISSNFLAGALGLSAGVMIFISLAELFPEAQAEITATGSLRYGRALTLLAFFAGMGIIMLIDFLVPEYENPHEASGLSLGAHTPAVDMLSHAGNEKALQRLGLMSAFAIAIHNFPEGIATFIGALNDPQMGLGITFAISIHNIPEGIAVSVPIYQATGSRKKAFMYSFMSGLAEPVGALLGWLILIPIMSDMVYGIIFAGVAGIMVFISVDELLPAAREYGEHHLSIYGLIGGMMVMAASLLLFM